MPSQPRAIGADGRRGFPSSSPRSTRKAPFGETVRRTLASRAAVTRRGGLSGMDVLVVSDGSSDRTEEIARSFPEVKVLAFDRNRGYGVAIRTGFEHARGDLLAFMDADGTCDPLLFGELCAALDERAADVALGSRMGVDREFRTTGLTGFLTRFFGPGTR